MLVAVLIHFLSKARISAANIEDLESWLNVLSDNILDASVSLIPIEGLLISMYGQQYVDLLLITVLPILGFSVLCHYYL